MKDWDPSKEGFVKLNKPLSEVYQNQAVVKGETASLVKKYIGRDTMYGVGKCFLWEHDVPVRKVLAKHEFS